MQAGQWELCVLFHPCETLLQSFDEPKTKIEQGNIYRLINGGDFEGMKGWISLTWGDSLLTECQLTVMLGAPGASLAASTWWRSS